MKHAAALLLILTVVACATSSGNRPANIAQPEIRVQQTSSLFFGSTSTSPLSLDVAVTNRANVPLRVREIQLSSPGMVQYTIRPVSRQFNDTLQPGETKTLGLVTTAIARQARLQVSEPLAIRAFVRLEANGKQFAEIVTEQFAGAGV
jgi:hypothetical protein